MVKLPIRWCLPVSEKDKKENKKKERRFIDTYVSRIKPASESTRPSSQEKKKFNS
jgi:hypothetical protein